MDTASLSEIKKELGSLPTELITEHCLRLIKYKKENKELLSYLLFEVADEQAYIKRVKEEIDGQLKNLNKTNLYLAKKTLRKILRTTNKYIRFSVHKTTEVELLIYFCNKLRKSGLPVNRNKVLKNMYQRQIDRINKVMSALHEDLQFDYRSEIELLMK
jgi:uncharacterized FlaG/YvyC family protein